jgi:hypothetical protein
VIPRPTNKPGDYTLGSLASRVAARAMLERIEADRKKNLDLLKIEFTGLGDDDQTLEFYVPKKAGNR